MSSSMAGLSTAHAFPASVSSQQQQQQQLPPSGTVPPRHHQRSKSSVLRSLMGGGHKRNNSDGSALPSTPLVTPIATTPAFHMSQQSLAPGRNSGVFHVGFDAAAAAAMEPQRYAHALGELPQNRQEQSPERRGRDRGDQAPSSPTKTGFSSISLRPFGRDRDSSKPPKTRDNSPSKPKKAKSATNLAALLRPKSIKNLKQLLTDDGDAGAKEKDKENRSPANSFGSDLHVSLPPPTPIYAQFASQNSGLPSPQFESSLDMRSKGGNPAADRPGAPASSASSLNKKPRPKSFQPYIGRKDDDTKGSTRSSSSDNRAKRMTWGKNSTPTAAARPMMGSRRKSSTSPTAGVAPEMPAIDPKDIDKHLEAMLDRRNIPENQRYKMRNLSETIKMELIRQDWAEMQGKLDRPSSHDGNPQAGGGTGPTTAGPSDQQDENTTGSPTKKEKKKHSRGLSLTIVRGGGNKSNPASPTKKKGDSSLGRHFRTKSSESVASEPPSPYLSGYGASFLAKVKGQQLPGDFVAYLQKVPQPELVEVGKLHKLRLLLRNETVAWTEEFIRQGGMKEIVELLHRIMAVEWREEHEDALLHENLLCLKALCTTDMALQYLHSIHATLFPALLHMIFDPEKKGPSEFTTRNIITSLLLTYIECATPQERVHRARAVLGFLRDPEPKEEDRPVDFVLEMRRERPYRVWCKEVVNVTKEVFWIFLHNLNIVALPSADNKQQQPSSTDKAASESVTTLAPPAATPSSVCSSDPSDHLRYLTRHFPQERPPVPAAPYVGGVEWDATNYLASHLDLLNAIIACTGPTAAERNTLRAQLRISGWERCLGGSLRLCKEKFYGAVHDGLRCWVAAAAEDGWDVRDVRYGPPPSDGRANAKRSGGGASPGKKPNGAAAVKQHQPPPKIEMPRLDFGGPVGVGNGLDSGVTKTNEPWLS
ncbi:armadillo-type protein [Corynascus novoguineensis]|uniref:Armadillo-type protein n=1 Tax=Corynascus novoguineensis TaxID=1126955 RepID=A0AAN7HPL5_9PEZI|nr:armadillo-type protein [Corynascus novoguineensis]